MSIDKYLDKVYDEKNYNCSHFAAEVWKDLTGIDISNLIGQVYTSRRANAHKAELRQFLGAFQALEKPVSPCIALFILPRKTTHVGIVLDGRILHIGPKGVEWTFAETIMINFKKVRYYNVKNNYC